MSIIHQAASRWQQRRPVLRRLAELEAQLDDYEARLDDYEAAWAAIEQSARAGGLSLIEGLAGRVAQCEAADAALVDTIHDMCEMAEAWPPLRVISGSVR